MRMRVTIMLRMRLRKKARRRQTVAMTRLRKAKMMTRKKLFCSKIHHLQRLRNKNTLQTPHPPPPQMILLNNPTDSQHLPLKTSLHLKKLKSPEEGGPLPITPCAELPAIPRPT
jgi:hypothetical protein